jgi:hypothetical protein
MRKGLQGVLAVSLVFCIHTLRADDLVAHIRGTVADPASARVPGAEVVATNTETKVSTKLTSTKEGTFEFLSLPIGTYEVTVSKDGFRTSTTRNILLRLNQIYNLDVTLELGRQAESVQVDANPVQVETAVTQMGAVIDGATIVDLPLLNRAWVSLEQLVPGVVASSDRFGAGYAYATNGSESQQNSFLINGADSMDLRLNQPLVRPSPDSIGEFNLIDSTINPEYGRNSGAILNAILKSGTNFFHGTAFEFYRDTFLNARNFFQTSTPVFHQNQFGGVLTGPIVKQHSFFMISYQGTRNRAPDSNETTTAVPVYSAAQRAGYFPDIATSTAVSPIPLVAESGATMAAGTPYNILFPTGHIPAADFNPLSANLMNKYVPQATLPGGLFGYNPVQTENQQQGVARLDNTITTKDTIWGSLFLQHDPLIHSLPFLGSTLPGFGEQDTSFTSQFVGAWDHTFNATTLNEVRLSYLRFNYNNTAPLSPALPSSYGFTGINPEFPGSASMPYIQVTGYFNLGFSPYGPQPVISNTYQLDDNFSKVHGNHTFKFGFDGRRYQVYNTYDAQNNGEFIYGGSGQYSTGDPGADFLLGFPDTYIQGSGGIQDFRTYEIYLYAQDSWKVRRNLTLNYGAGYQIDTPLENQHFDKLDNNCFIPGEQSTVFPTAPLGLTFPGDKGCTLSGYHAHYDHIGPRFGFAYTPGNGKKTVIRGGFGIYFNRTEEELGLQQLSAAPFSITNFGVGNIGGSPSFANPFRDVATGQFASNPFPFIPATKGQAVDFSAFYPLDMNISNPNSTSPYAMNFNLNVQRELPGSMLLQVGYVGAQGRHLEIVYEGNPISPAGQAECAADPACIADRANQHVDYPTHALYAPGNIFASVGTQGTFGVSSYNSLQITLTKRLSHGLSFLAAYTWSHSIDDTSGYEGSGAAPGYYRAPDPYDFASYRGDSIFDARQRFVFSYDWLIPSASKRWNNLFAREILDGWKLAGITTLQSGFPVTVGDSFGFQSLSCDQYVYYACWDTPNAVGTPTTYNVRNSTLVNTATNPANTTALNDYYFNPNAFAVEAFGKLGNEGRNNFHGPGINNTDLSLIKDIKLLKESQKLELRMDTFNTFNHTQFRFSSSILSFSDINSGNFGRALSAAPGRVVQLAVKLYF